MKRFVMLLMVLLVSCALVAAVIAADTKAPPVAGKAQAAAPAKAKSTTLKGEVVEVQPTVIVILVEEKGQKAQKKVSFDEKVKLWGIKKVDELKAGTKVVVKAVDKEGNLVATDIKKGWEKTKKAVKEVVPSSSTPK